MDEKIIEKIRAMGACNSGLQWLSEQPSVDVALEDASTANLTWLAQKINPAEYERVRAPALAEYERVCDTAFTEYERVCDTALAEYERVRAPAFTEYERVCDTAFTEYERIRAPAFTEYERVCAPAFKLIILAWVSSQTNAQ